MRQTQKINMRLLPVCLVLLLLAGGCQEEEEIVPITTESKTTEAAPEEPEKFIGPNIDMSSDVFQPEMFKGLPYRVLVPQHYDSTKSYPLLVFLHGVGERGTDNQKQLNIGGSRFLADSIRDNYPAFIIYPQCPPDKFWSDDEVSRTVRDLVDMMQRLYAINRQRTSIAGFSMGAYGTFDMVARYPGVFDAAVAIAGDGNKKKAPTMTGSRWRIFAGKLDTVVPSLESQKMAEALRSQGASVSFTLFTEGDHGSLWAHALSEPDFFRWLFTDSKS
jgi:predicted peptidase